MADGFTQADAEAAGWRIVHEGVDPNAEDATANATYHRAEKYHSPPGATATLIEETAADIEQLFERIAWREQWLGSMSGGDAQNTVMVPAEGHEGDVDTSDPSTFDRVPDDAITAARDNDVLTVLSDPEDPDSEPVQKVIVGGEEQDVDVLSEPAAPASETEAQTIEANQAAIDAATGARDDADTPDKADGPNAAAAAAQARHDSLQAAHDNAGANLQGQPGDSGNQPDTVQPEAGEATDASDSEQQGQVNDTEAASSDAAATTPASDPFPTAGQSQPEVAGPNVDTLAPDPAPNAGQGVSATGIPAHELGNAGSGGNPHTDVTPTDKHA